MTCVGRECLDQIRPVTRLDQALAGGADPFRVLDPRLQPGPHVPRRAARLFACETHHAGQVAHELFDLGFRHGSIVVEQPQVRRHQRAISLHALAQVHQRARQVGQRPVEVGAPRLLHHLFQVPRLR